MLSTLTSSITNDSTSKRQNIQLVDLWTNIRIATLPGAIREGQTAIPFGFVRVYAERNFYVLEFIWQGKSDHVGCRCDRLLTDKALAARASRLDREVVKSSLDTAIAS
jgi:hypothetical protein